MIRIDLSEKIKNAKRPESSSEFETNYVKSIKNIGFRYYQNEVLFRKGPAPKDNGNSDKRHYFTKPNLADSLETLGDLAFFESFKEECKQIISWDTKGFLLAKPDKLKKLSTVLQKADKENKEALINRLKGIFNYSDQFAKTIRKSFAELDFPTCIYCNRVYLLKIEGTSKRGYDLDHFFNKNDHPHLALSLYNLIPSCKQCNSATIKGSTDKLEKSKNPWDKNFDFHKHAQFKLIHKKYMRLTIDDQEYEAYEDVFHLSKVYRNYDHQIQALVDLRQKYSDSKIKELQEQTGLTKNELEYLIFNPHEHTATSHDRVLSKLRFDLCKDLNLHRDSFHPSDESHF